MWNCLIAALANYCPASSAPDVFMREYRTPPWRNGPWRTSLNCCPVPNLCHEKKQNHMADIGVCDLYLHLWVRVQMCTVHMWVCRKALHFWIFCAWNTRLCKYFFGKNMLASLVFLHGGIDTYPYFGAKINLNSQETTCCTTKRMLPNSVLLEARWYDSP